MKIILSLLLILPAVTCLAKGSADEAGSVAANDNYLLSSNQNVSNVDEGRMYSYRDQRNHHRSGSQAERETEAEEFGIISILILTVWSVIFYYVTFRIFSFISWIAIGFTVWQMVHSFLLLDYNYVLTLSPTLLVGSFFAYRKLKSIEVHD